MAQMRFDPVKPLDELGQIIGQIEAAKDVDRSARQQSKVWENIAARFDEALTGMTNSEGLYKGLEVSASGLAEAASVARKVAETLNPVAEVSWTKEHLDELLVAVRFFSTAGAYEDGQLQKAVELVEKASAVSKGKGTGSRGVAPVVPGRPEYVEVWTDLGADEGPERVSRQKGNSENSPGNILKSVTTWLERREIAVSDEMEQAIREAVRECVVDGVSEVAIGDFATIRHAS